jgi:protein SCO1
MNDLNPQSRHMAGKGTLVFIVIVAALAGTALSWFLFNPMRTANANIAVKQATVLRELRPLPPFVLTDQHGKRFDNTRLQGKWTLLSFGYTNCPDICPTDLAMLAQVDDRLSKASSMPPYQIGFVSVDPARDTPDRLAQYVTYFDPTFLGVTGSEAALRTLTRPLGIIYAKVETKDSAIGYVMDHSASIVLLDPKGRYRALFSPPHHAKYMAHDVLAIAQAQ